MMNLTPTTIAPYSLFGEIVEAKKSPRKQRLRALAEKIREQYDNYNDNRTELSVMVAYGYTGTDQDDLEHCYTGVTEPLSKLLADIVDRQRLRIRLKCQYCSINNHDTFDHYLPISLFPEFSVHALNLLPCCSVCNRKKGNTFISARHEREIINFYFDTLPDERFLEAIISYTGVIPVATYSLRFSASIPSNIRRRLQMHYQRLDLLERYKRNSSEVFSETRSTIRTHLRTNSLSEVRAYLLAEAGRLSTRISINYWKTVLYGAMSNNTTFMNSCLVAV